MVTQSLLMIALVGCTDNGALAPKDGGNDGTTGGSTAPSIVDTAVYGDTDDTVDPGPDVDCSVLPKVPVTYDEYPFFETAEDFDIDGEGYLGTINNGNLVGMNFKGDVKIIGASVVGSSAFTAGTRILPTGDWVVADVSDGALVLYKVKEGVKEILLGGLSYPNGVEVDSQNRVYVAENSGGRARWVDAYNPDNNGILSNGLTQPNGVILSPDEQTVYIGSFGGGVVYAIDRLGPDEWDYRRILYEATGSDNGYDPIHVDVCGNVYFGDFVSGRIWRVTPDGSQYDLLVDLPSSWIPNMRWGHGIGGWETDILYVTEYDNVFALHMGIEGKKHVLLP